MQNRNQDAIQLLLGQLLAGSNGLILSKIVDIDNFKQMEGRILTEKDLYLIDAALNLTYQKLMSSRNEEKKSQLIKIDVLLKSMSRNLSNNLYKNNSNVKMTEPSTSENKAAVTSSDPDPNEFNDRPIHASPIEIPCVLDDIAKPHKKKKAPIKKVGKDSIDPSPSVSPVSNSPVVRRNNEVLRILDQGVNEQNISKLGLFCVLEKQSNKNEVNGSDPNQEIPKGIVKSNIDNFEKININKPTSKKKP